MGLISKILSFVKSALHNFNCFTGAIEQNYQKFCGHTARMETVKGFEGAKLRVFQGKHIASATASIAKSVAELLPEN